MDMYLLIAIISSVILLSYFFEMFKNKIAIPSILLLILSGFIIKYILDYFAINLHFLDEALPYLGTIGLILIVLEGSFDLVLKSEKKFFILKNIYLCLISFDSNEYFYCFYF